MAAFTWTCTCSYGLGGNYEVQVVAPSQSEARRRAERMTGDKCIRATR